MGDLDSTRDDFVVEYENNPLGAIELAIYAWRFKDTKKFLITWNKVIT